MEGLDALISKIVESISSISTWERGGKCTLSSGLVEEGAILLPMDFAKLEAMDDRLEQLEDRRPREEEDEQRELE